MPITLDLVVSYTRKADKLILLFFMKSKDSVKILILEMIESRLNGTVLKLPMSNCVDTTEHEMNLVQTL